MKVKFIKDFGVGAIGIKTGEEFEVTRIKEPDKWNDYVRYQIKLAGIPGVINVPAVYVQELK